LLYYLVTVSDRDVLISHYCNLNVM